MCYNLPTAAANHWAVDQGVLLLGEPIRGGVEQLDVARFFGCGV